MHGVIAVGQPEELAWARAYLMALRKLAPRYGFGFVDGWEKVSRKFSPGDQAGAYLSGYFVRGRGRKASLTDNVLDGDLPRIPVFVGRHLTSQTRVTMRSLRHVKKLWAFRAGRVTHFALSSEDALVASMLLERMALRARAP